METNNWRYEKEVQERQRDHDNLLRRFYVGRLGKTEEYSVMLAIKAEYNQTVMPFKVRVPNIYDLDKN